MRALTRPDADALAVFGKALSSPARIQIVVLLQRGPTRVYNLRQTLAEHGTVLGQPTISHHLGRLVRAGLVVRESDANDAAYRLSPAGELVVASFLGGAG
jgi:DNA-binding transcriptional ArsR family regulator